MKKLQLVPVFLTVLLLSACSPRVAQPPPLEELEPPADSGLSSDLGPRDFGDPSGAGTEGWGDFTGSQPLGSRPTGEWQGNPSLQPIYFAYDRYDLDDKTRRTLLNNAEHLRQNPDLRVLVEGHCDERGTEEYNQALGENRALAVREYLIQLGLSPSRIDVLSYGELMPAVEGHTEAAWQFNRRAEFKTSG